VGVGPGVRLKTDVNTDGRTDDKMDTGNSGAGEHAIDNCLLLYVQGAGSEMSEDADGGALPETSTSPPSNRGLSALANTCPSHRTLTMSVDL
jgi:hypothetical protein